MLLDILFPVNCYACHRPDFYLCPRCQQKLTHLAFNPFPPPPLAGLLSLFRYHHPLRANLTALKYNFVSHQVPELAHLASAHLKFTFPHLLSFWQDNNFSILPIPLHPRRWRWRGFNQSSLLAQNIAKSLHLSFSPDLLIRTRSLLPQVKLPPAQRIKNPVNSFRLLSPPPPNVILFDDVYTTGATIHSAALAFPKNCQIYALTLAG